MRNIPGDQMILLQMSRVTMASSFNWQNNRILILDLLFCEVGSETRCNVLDTFITLICWINQFNYRVLILIILCIKILVNAVIRFVRTSHLQFIQFWVCRDGKLEQYFLIVNPTDCRIKLFQISQKLLYKL